ncbi:MAG TPA: hypothetical protein VNI54_11250 [Thermoanaerobaculia bacterium]|nr:hypothetical protein [Thermoanaerobaculia bacterium]
MLRQRPDLIVPIRDRRQHKRYLTLKNFGIATVAAAVVFAGITIRSEMRGRKPGEFGRLFQNEMATDVEQKSVEVVKETPPAAIVDAAPVQPAPFVIEDVGGPVVPPAPAPVRASASEVAVVGGPDGVSVVRKEPRPKPVLTGGFGR